MFDNLVVVRARRFAIAQLEARDHVVENRHHREGIRLLEDHANATTHAHRVGFRRVDILSIKQHLAFDARILDRFVHPVERAQKGRFARS